MVLNAITHNFRLMVAEVKALVGQVAAYQPAAPDAGDPDWEALKNRRAYIGTLADLIQNKTFALLIAARKLEREQTRTLRAMATISAHLDTMVDLAFNVGRQKHYLVRFQLAADYDLAAFFQEVTGGLGRLGPAWDNKDTDQAFSLGQTEARLDQLYTQVFKRVLAELEKSSTANTPGDLVTILMMAHYLERMGDRLLNIGESIIYYLVGEQLKFSQYLALSDSLSRLGQEGALTAITFESIWGGRSGCRLGVVGSPDQADGEAALLFKAGRAGKVAKERENLNLWEDLAPGLPPKVRAFVPGQEGEDASLMMQYLPGQTLKELALLPEGGPFFAGLTKALATLGDIWARTREEWPAAPAFVAQIEKRWASILTMHEALLPKRGHFGPLALSSLPELLERARPFDRELTAPFSVRIHGDFNLGNIIYDAAAGRLNLIDLHRSAEADYLQDLSVLLVSLFRLPAFGATLRRRLRGAGREVLVFAERFATDQGDASFQARLALGLARSFLTSSRFELRRSFARQLIDRSTYLFQKLLAHREHGRPWPDFQLCPDVVYL